MLRTRALSPSPLVVEWTGSNAKFAVLRVVSPYFREINYERIHREISNRDTSKGGYTDIFSSKSVSDKTRANSVTIFPTKKKQNGEGGLPPSPPHLLLAWENRFYLEVRDCA